MNRAQRALQFLTTASAGLLVTGVAFVSLETWAGMTLPAGTAALAALAAAALPGYLANRTLTRSYSRIEGGASEWGSIFGMLLLANLLLVPALWSGLAGVPASVATEQTLDLATWKLGLVDEPSERTVEAFPRARMDTGVLWVPNVGTADQPRVIARRADGILKIEELGPQGTDFTDAAVLTVRGPVSLDGSEVMLAPVPTDSRETRRIEVDWEGGTARFLLSENRRKATFLDR